MIHLVETQCRGKETENADTCCKSPVAQDAKEKQSTLGSADASQPIQESVNGSPVLISDSQQGRALNHRQKDPAMASATA